MSGRDALLHEVRRAILAFRAESAEELLREVETRLAPGHRKAVLTRGRLLEEIEPALRAAFPHRAEALLSALMREMWPGGVMGPWLKKLPEGPAPVEGEARGTGDVGSAHGAIDLERDADPSFVAVTPGTPWTGLRLLVHLDSTIIGRSPDVDFPIPDDALSPRHVMITRDASGGVLLEDVGNSELLVNGKQTHWTWVQDGDEVRLTARTSLRFITAG